MSTGGDELVTIEQFKMAVSGGGGMEEAMQDSDVVVSKRNGNTSEPGTDEWWELAE